MFTGIIEDSGKVIKVGREELTLSSVLKDIKTGDSISVNGVCLTVRQIKSDVFTVDISQETYKRTNLGRLKAGDRVNLERSLKLDGRLGGHIVTGHIEGIGKILSVKGSGDKSGYFTFSYPESIKKYIVPKGSIAVDGISLTVVEAKNNKFSAAIIPHTLKNTTLGFKKINDTVNLEPDILAKYVENIYRSKKSNITTQFLKDKGFI